MWLIFLEIFVVLCVIYFFFKVAGIKFTGRKSNPFGMFFALNIFIISLPGIILVSSIRVDTFLNSGIFSVSSSTVSYVTYSYFFSLAVILLMILSSSLIFRGFHIRESCVSSDNQLRAVNTFIVISLWLNAAFLAVLMVKIGISNIPLLEGIRGDIGKAQILKAKLITGDIAKLPESINQIFRVLIPLTAYMAADRYFSDNKVQKRKISLILSVVLALIYYTYDLQKAPIFLFIFGILFIHNFHRGLNWKILLTLPILVAVLLGINAFYFGVTELDDLSFLVEKVATRLFIMQNQGMYYIIEHITPSLDYLKNGAILSSYVFSEAPEPAASTVMEIMYGYAEANVNMNTYFLGEAYSIAGVFGVVLGSIVVASHLCIYLILFKKLYERNIVFFMPLSVVFYLFYIPINQGFNSFLYGRNLIFFFVFSFLIYYLYSLLINRRPRKLSITGFDDEG